jgi:hypothetical protein
MGGVIMTPDWADIQYLQKQIAELEERVEFLESHVVVAKTRKRKVKTETCNNYHIGPPGFDGYCDTCRKAPSLKAKKVKP